jgi:hypothetical protein
VVDGSVDASLHVPLAAGGGIIVRRRVPIRGAQFALSLLPVSGAAVFCRGSFDPRRRAQREGSS